VWSFERLERGWRLTVVDGLGHGPLAREAALCVLHAVAASPPGPARALENAHLAARPTRGAAASVAEAGGAELRFVGVGNVAGLLHRPRSDQNLVSLNGTLGQGRVRPREFTYPLEAGSLVILSSDGLATRWSLDAYPGLSVRHPSLVAGVLYRDFSRRRDDVTVAVVRQEP
jgi:hypothetical protein